MMLGICFHSYAAIIFKKNIAEVGCIVYCIVLKRCFALPPCQVTGYQKFFFRASPSPDRHGGAGTFLP